MSESANDTAPSRKLDLGAYLPTDVEEVLAFRLVKRSMTYMAAVVGLIGAVFGYAGCDILKHLEQSEKTLTDQVTATAVAAQVQQRKFDEQSKELARLVDEMRSQAENLERRSETYQAVLQGSLRSMGGQDERFNRNIAESGSLAKSVDAKLKRLEELDRDMEATRKLVELELGAMKQGLSGVTGTVEGIQNLVLNSGSFVVKERTERQELPGMDLRVSVGIIKKSLLAGFEIRDMGDNTVWGPKDLGHGIEVGFDANGNHYTLRSTYVLEYFGKDAAGLDVKRNKLSAPALAVKATAR